MPDFEDIVGGLIEAGGQGKGWRSWWAILGLILGAGLGGWIGYDASGVMGALSGAATGGFLGWIVSLLLHGLLRIAVIFGAVLVIVLGYQWLTGGF